MKFILQFWKFFSNHIYFSFLQLWNRLEQEEEIICSSQDQSSYKEWENVSQIIAAAFVVIWSWASAQSQDPGQHPQFLGLQSALSHLSTRASNYSKTISPHFLPVAPGKQCQTVARHDPEQGRGLRWACSTLSQKRDGPIGFWSIKSYFIIASDKITFT